MGSRKGRPNKATANAREAIAKLVDGNAHKLQGWLEEIEREQGALMAWKCVMDVVEYHIPRLARTEHTGGIEHRHTLVDTLRRLDQAPAVQVIEATDPAGIGLAGPSLIDAAKEPQR